MQRILLLLVFFTSAPVMLIAQNFEWAKQIGGSGSETSHSMCLDDHGNIYTIGTFSGVVDFDPDVDTFLMGTAGKTMVYLSKMNQNGDFLWSKQFNFGHLDLLTVAPDHAGNIYLTGYFDDTVDFDPGLDSTLLNSNAYGTAFVSKMDSNGNFLWARKFDGKVWTDDSKISSIAFDDQNNIYTTGSFSGTIDFNPAVDTFYLTSEGNYGDDIFISKLDVNGNFLWAKRMGGDEGYDGGESIQVDNYGNIYIAGYFYETADLDPNSGIFNLEADFYGFAYFLVKLNPDASLNWAETIGSYSYFPSTELILDANYNIYLAGTFDGYMDFDPGEGTQVLIASDDNSFVLKLDNYGNFLWVNHISSGDSNRVHSIAVDAAYNTYVTGYIKGGAEFGADSLHPNGSHEAFISKLNCSGNFIWAETLGGSGSDVGTSLAVDADNNIYANGYFEQTSDFDPWGGDADLTSNGSTDLYFHKINQCGPLSSSETLTACGSSYFWRGQLLDSSGTYVDTIQTIVGCDSILTLNLTLKMIDTSISTIPPKLVSNSETGSYQWIDCGKSFKPISGENRRSFVPDTNGFYAVIITEGICSDTSACYAVVNAGLAEFNNKLKALVFPNPATQFIEVHFEGILKNANVELFDVRGKSMFAERGLIGEGIKIDLSNYPDGLYFLSVEDEGKIFIGKVVKQ